MITGIVPQASWETDPCPFGSFPDSLRMYMELGQRIQRRADVFQNPPFWQLDTLTHPPCHLV